MFGNTRRTRALDLTSGPIVSGVVRFALPLLGSSVAQQLYGTVDLIFAGNVLGPDAMAAIGIGTLLISCLIGLLTGVSVGVNVVVARRVGSAASDGRIAAADKADGSRTAALGNASSAGTPSDTADGVSEAIHTAVLAGLIGGAALAVLGALLAPLYLTWMATPAQVVGDALTYLRTYFVSMLAVVMYNQCAGILRGLGDSRTPLTAQVVGGLCNIAMNALFLVVLHLGVAGTALATLASQGVACVLCLHRLASLPGPWRLRLSRLAIHPATLRRILGIGVPTGLQSLVITLSNVFVQHQINLLGATAIAAYSAYYKVELPIYYVLVALGQAATTFVAQNHAARQESRARRGTRVCLGLGVVASVVLAALLLVGGRVAFGLFSSDGEVVEAGCAIAGVTFPLYWLYAFLEVNAASLRGRGHALAPMVIIMVNVFVLRTALLSLLTAHGPTLTGVALVYPLTWASTAVCMTACHALILRDLRRRSAQG